MTFQIVKDPSFAHMGEEGLNFDGCALDYSIIVSHTV